jgi:putative membrane-bound dehydrogenase-like protein
VFKYAGLPPEKAAQVMTVPEGFTVTLFAGEPDVHQPVAFCIDDRGRLWVAEAYCYPTRKPFPGLLLPEAERAGGDRILIFEDTDGDGKFDKKAVFMEGFNLLSGIEVGFGGVWVGAAPYFAFIPVDASGDKPAGPPQILLDGWHYEDTHETLNTFTWGPDGWLYGCHGVFTHSRVGKPSTPDKDRTPINAGIWRYHPTRHQFEVFAEGTSNPWGIDFDEYGQLFCEACVIPHCYHLIQGGRYLRQAGNHFNPHTYADIQTIADHRHYLGSNPHRGNNRSDSAGGGHAHCGLMAYLGGAWPEQYCGQLFMGNIHGRRLNVDVPKPKGSGFVASHGPDFLLANDEWARFINLKYGPDGNVYLIDWYDKQACHDTKPDIWDRTNGRIYKISYRGTKPVTGVDLQKCSDKQLVEYQLSDNEWYVRHARRILQEWFAERPGKPTSAGNYGMAPPWVVSELSRIASEHPDDRRRLRALWALHGLSSSMYKNGIMSDSGLKEPNVLKALSDPSPHVRAWVIQLALDGWTKMPDAFLRKFAELAQSDPSPVVRLYLASAAQRMPLAQRWDLVERLAAHGEDSGDHNLPLMVWYAAEPLAGEDPGRALALAAKAKLPLLAFTVRRIAAAGTPESIALLVEHLGRTDESASQRTVLAGLAEALKGRRQVAMPAAWPATFAKLRAGRDADVKTLALALAVTFGDPQAFAELRGVLASADAAPARRQAALASFLGAKDPKLAPVLHKLVADQALRGSALRGLAAYDDPQTPGVILAAYPSLTTAEKRDALNTLAARPAYAAALLDAVAAKTVAATDISADVVRQLRNLRDAELNRRIGEVWGVVRDTPADRARLIAQYRRLLTSAPPVAPDAALGRAMFVKTCAQCHTLFGTGGKVGPDISGANRGDLNYLLENILDPSAVIPKEYAATTLNLKSGRIVTGIVRGETPAAFTVVTANETLTVPKEDVESHEPSATSMMPDDLVKNLTEPEVRSLIAYLQSPAQVPVLATADNAKDLFNGKDLTGWDSDPKLWSVENGEIVGRSPGIKHNEFLKSELVADNFRLTLKVKLTPNQENSGVQFRSEPLPNGEVRGPQADVGAGWWGKLYEENGRGLIWKESGEAHVKPNDWNEYTIEAVGSRVRTWINGKPCVDLDDPSGRRRGFFAFQIHAGGPMEVRFKDIKLEVLGAK